MIKEWLEEYKPANHDEAEKALREIMQEIALAGLQRSGFFENAAFYGGTALRIFHNLQRFSEDLDFSLLESDPAFSLQPHLESVRAEFSALGVNVDIKGKNKTTKSAIDSAFLKADTEWKEITLKSILPQEGLGLRPNIKIKIEVDTKPPLGFTTEELLLLKPFSCYIKCFRLPDLFSGKMHALLFRRWKDRVKGRDWYDMEWYIKKNIPLHLHHFCARAQGSGDWQGETISQQQFMNLMNKKIDTVSFKNIREDIRRFVPDEKEIEIWSPSYFKSLVQKLKFEQE